MPRIYSVSSGGRFNSIQLRARGPRPPPRVLGLVGGAPGADSSGEGASPVASPSRRLSSGFVYWTPYAAVVVVLRARPNALRFDLAGPATPRTGSGGGTLDSNPELWTVPLAGRPAAVRGPSRSSRLGQKARGRFSAGGLQWRRRARHLPRSRALLTIASYRMRPTRRSPLTGVAMAQWIRRGTSNNVRPRLRISRFSLRIPNA